MPLFSSLSNTVNYFYYRYRNNWTFPPSMVHSSGARIAAGTYEPEVSAVICRELGSGDTFIDAGANVGYFSRMAAEQVGDGGRVYAFEMEPDNYKALNDNIAHLSNVVPVCAGLSDEPCIIDFNRSSHSTCHSLVDTGNYLDGTTFRNMTIKLDRFWEVYMDRTPADLVKIDVEGAEIDLLKGMSRMLEQGAVRSMIVEFCPALLVNCERDPETVFQILSRHFSLEVIERGLPVPGQSPRLDSLEAFRTFSRMLLDREGAVNVNLLCRKN